MSPAKASHVFSDILLYAASFLIGVAALLFPFPPEIFRGWYSTFLILGVVLLMQWGMLSSRRNWLRIRVQSSGRPMKRAVIGAAFFAMLLSVGFGATFLEVVNLFDLELRYGWPTIVACLFLWAFWACLFFVYWRGSEYPTPVSRMVGRLIAGTAVQTFVATAVYVWNPQNESCECARGSFTGLSIGGTLLVWLFGPGLLLLSWREHERQQRMKDHGLIVQDLPATPPQKSAAADGHCDSPLSVIGVGIIAVLLILLVVLEINTPFYTIVSKPVHGTPAVPVASATRAVADFYNGLSHSDRAEWDAAIKDYSEAISLKPDYLNAYHNRGIAYENQGDQAKADADFAKAKELRAKK